MRVQQLKFQNRLDESTVDAALAGNDHAFVMAALTVLAGLSLNTIRKTVQTQSAKGIVAVTWKAGLSMAFCEQLQIKLLRLAPSRQLHAVNGTFPLTAEEMTWQLEFLGD
ncbi:MAG: DUF2336 domain-containing protein [Magnetospirillum sp.]|nr:DUF2336 domain-containing protein [Magnetospirillum sp.]